MTAIHNLSRSLKRWLVVLLLVAVALGCWFTHDWYRHRILVLLPDGTHAPSPSVKLDYDPVYEYHPTTIQGRDGTVFIPSARAYGRGWETMHISAVSGGKRYHAQRYPNQCSYPMRVTLEELPPAPPSLPAFKLERAIELLNEFKNIIRESRR